MEREKNPKFGQRDTCAQNPREKRWKKKCARGGKNLDIAQSKK